MLDPHLSLTMNSLYLRGRLNRFFGGDDDRSEGRSRIFNTVFIEIAFIPRCRRISESMILPSVAFVKLSK